jgi:DNA-binding transcriptional LysR family regulator
MISPIRVRFHIHELHQLMNDNCNSRPCCLIGEVWTSKQGKRFVLTDEGRAMLPAATDHAERWRRFTAFAAAGNRPGLSVACGQEAAGTGVLRAATAFRRRHPDALLRLAVVRGRRRIEGVANGLYDLALVTHSSTAIRELARREVVIEPLAEDVLMLACGLRSPWCACPPRRQS